MKFYDLIDFYAFMKRLDRSGKNLTAEQFYVGMQNVAAVNKDVFVYRQSQMELAWLNHKKPYYNVYPAIFPMVEKLNLNVPCSLLNIPMEVLCLRLPEPPHNPFIFDGQVARTILFQHQEVSKEKGSDELVKGMVISIDAGEREARTGCPIQIFKIFPLREDMTINEVCNILPYHRSLYQGVQVKEEMVNEIIKLCCTVCLIGNDPELVCPDVIAKEREKFETGDEETKKKIIEKSIRRGKYGFNLGANLEMIPHYRRPHLALVWTGKGKTTAKVVMRKGSVVHREKIVEVPSGYKGN